MQARLWQLQDMYVEHIVKLNTLTVSSHLSPNFPKYYFETKNKSISIPKISPPSLAQAVFDWSGVRITLGGVIKVRVKILTFRQ